MFYFTRTPSILSKIMPSAMWSVPGSHRGLYLTFDDGPSPEITDWVLDRLAEYHAEATFFCLGKNLEAHPGIASRTMNCGHTIGNHTFGHLNGWKTGTDDYIKDVDRCNALLSSLLFRPPYGRISSSQYRLLKDQYRIVMWSLLSADFDANISKERCLQNVIRNARSGDIIVFHDSVRAWPRLEYVLPRALENLAEKGFHFKKLTS